MHSTVAHAQLLPKQVGIAQQNANNGTARVGIDRAGGLTLRQNARRRRQAFQ